MDTVVDFNLVQGEKGAPRWHHPVSFTLQKGMAHVIRTRSHFSAPLFRLCLGFSEPTSGALTTQGTEPWKLTRGPVRELRKGIGSVLDPDGLVANLSMRMNLIVPLVFATGLEFDVAQERAAHMLDVMHLTMWADVRPAALPAEVRQCAALGRALCVEPSLLLLENPLASLDNRETRRLLSLCRARVETLLIATHRSDSILHEFADQVWDWDDDGFRMVA
jgi:ABC-type methionine transport system ATPase subunit